MTTPEPAGERAWAWFDGLLATELVHVTDNPAVLDTGGWWAVCITYEGRPTFAQFADVRPAPMPVGEWVGPARTMWRSSMSETDYITAVLDIQEHIAAGDIYQGNVCRVLQTPLPDRAAADLAGLACLLAARNPAPYAGVMQIPEAGVRVVSASPELYLRRDGRALTSQPIKGTGRTEADLQGKDIAENVMIVDLVRNDLSIVCEAGSVNVPELVALQHHPGLVHLASTVTGTLPEDATWAGILGATFPPGSVTGCPKPRAIELLADVEHQARGPYCGAIGYIDADKGTAVLAVGIRTFWIEDEMLHFGAGAGITAGSDPAGEWGETELKAANLLGVAAGVWDSSHMRAALADER